MPVDPTQLFLSMLDELRSIPNIPTHYQLLKASALIRQLLMDKHGLVGKANKALRKKLRFSVRSDEQDKQMFSRSNVTVFRGFLSLSTPPLLVSLNHFLSYVCLSYQGDTYTVSEIIKVAANKLGGIHYDEAMSDKRKSLQVGCLKQTTR